MPPPPNEFRIRSLEDRVIPDCITSPKSPLIFFPQMPSRQEALNSLLTKHKDAIADRTKMSRINRGSIDPSVGTGNSPLV